MSSLVSRTTPMSRTVGFSCATDPPMLMVDVVMHNFRRHTNRPMFNGVCVAFCLNLLFLRPPHLFSAKLRRHVLHVPRQRLQPWPVDLVGQVALPASRFEFERLDLAIISLLANQPVASESEHACNQSEFFVPILSCQTFN